MKTTMLKKSRLFIGACCLVLLWSLVFGVWSLFHLLFCGGLISSIIVFAALALATDPHSPE